MERRNGRHSERPDEVEHVRAVVTAPDAVLVLDRDDVHATVVEGPGDGHVVGLHVAPDAVADFRRIRARLIGRVEGDDLPLPNRRGEIVGEGRDAAAVWRIGRDEGGSGHRAAPTVARRPQGGATESSVARLPVSREDANPPRARDQAVVRRPMTRRYTATTTTPPITATTMLSALTPVTSATFRTVLAR